MNTSFRSIIIQSKAETVDQYIAELPNGRRSAIQAVRRVILDNLPEGYEEAMNWGMITYQVPIDVYRDTYNGKPLMYAALASQKFYMSVYLMGIYINDIFRNEFIEAYKSTGKPYNAGKSCLRFRRLEDLPIQLIGDTIAKFPVELFVNSVKEQRSENK